MGRCSERLVGLFRGLFRVCPLLANMCPASRLCAQVYLQLYYLPPSSKFFCLESKSFYLGTSMCRNVVKWANFGEWHTEFNVGEARYTAIPVKTDLSYFEDRSLVTVVPAQEADLLQYQESTSRCQDRLQY